MNLAGVSLVDFGNQFDRNRSTSFRGKGTIVLDAWLTVALSKSVSPLGPTVEAKELHLRIVFETEVDPAEVVLRAIVRIATPHHYVPLAGRDSSHTYRKRFALTGKNTVFQFPHHAGAARFSSASVESHALLESGCAGNVRKRAIARSHPTVPCANDPQAVALGKPQGFLIDSVSPSKGYRTDIIRLHEVGRSSDGRVVVMPESQPRVGHTLTGSMFGLRSFELRFLDSFWLRCLLC